MRRIASTPRADWQEKVEATGLTWHTSEHHAYWNESAFYEFTAKEVVKGKVMGDHRGGAKGDHFFT
jgi:glutathionylspermidine synthase